ncbi:hypothetical protein [Flavobacterium sp. LB2P74]|jgi:hypothetical protein|uniref:hypothetical protein n=1 Tax=Flavobacterium sp. LB2P74 TaxID=3401717 RepID=UPI003AAC47E6
MSNEDIYQRLEDLHNVLVYCSDLQKQGRIHVFKVGERICINQERGALLSQLSHANNETFSHEVREYKIPVAIEAKIKFTIEKIHATGWGGFSSDIILK